MSFNNPDKESFGSSRVYSRNYTWSGGHEEAIDPNDPSKGTKPGAIIKWREGTGDSAEKGVVMPPIKIAIIGVTFSVGKFIGSETPGANVNYTSNETSQRGQTLHLTKWTSRGPEPVKSGSYNDLATAVPGLKCRNHVYFYDFERQCIDRFTFEGSSYGAFKEYNNSVKTNKYTAPTIVEQGEYKTWNVGKAFLPKFSLGTPYTEAERAEISKVAEIMDEFEEKLAELARTGYSRGDSDFSGGEGVDQTPAAYDGEGSQELPDASTAAPAQPTNTTDLGDIPF